MKTTIYVFSGTGTSLAVAKKIQSKMKDCEVLSIPAELKKAGNNKITTTSPKVGLIFPCYFGEMPQIVIEFVRKMDFNKTDYIFSVVTAGGNKGYSQKFLEMELEKKGKRLNYGKSIVLSSNYIVGWYYSAILLKGEKLKNGLKLLNDTTDKIADDVLNLKEQIEKSSFVFYKIPHLLSPKEVVKDTRPCDKEFSADKNCTGCNTCQKVCPVQNIKIVDNKPEFQHNCQRCMACIQYCPNNAIQFNGKTLEKQKHFHPEFPAKEMMKFVKEGKLEIE